MTCRGSVGGEAGIHTFLFLPFHTSAQLGLALHRSQGGGRSGVDAREEMGGQSPFFTSPPPRSLSPRKVLTPPPPG